METQSGAVAGAAATTAEQALMEKSEEKKKMKVMVAIDESDGSFYALKWALDHLFGSMGVAPETNPDEVGTVVMVHVQQPFQQYVFPAGPGGAAFYATSTVVESVRKAQEENAAAILSRALQMSKDHKMVKAETLILDGEPKDMICQAAEQMKVDLLVVGSRGLGTLKRARILGKCKRLLCTSCKMSHPDREATEVGVYQVVIYDISSYVPKMSIIFSCITIVHKNYL